MPEEYFELAHINFDKVILHGRITAGSDEHGCRTEAYVEQVLTEEQRNRIGHMSTAHDIEMQRLLASFVDRDAAIKGASK